MILLKKIPQFELFSRIMQIPSCFRLSVCFLIHFLEERELIKKKYFLGLKEETVSNFSNRGKHNWPIPPRFPIHIKPAAAKSPLLRPSHPFLLPHFQPRPQPPDPKTNGRRASRLLMKTLKALTRNRLKKSRFSG